MKIMNIDHPVNKRTFDREFDRIFGKRDRLKSQSKKKPDGEKADKKTGD